VVLQDSELAIDPLLLAGEDMTDGFHELSNGFVETIRHFNQRFLGVLDTFDMLVEKILHEQ